MLSVWGRGDAILTTMARFSESLTNLNVTPGLISHHLVQQTYNVSHRYSIERGFQEEEDTLTLL